ncbi:GNAT family N-acetyltransferase [[Pseudomonas] carboxydohydrogena]|uniref:GNAT family N-acetyltransferase n=1 Tax=Afipia carboxydohydrogena TaxID=290 RepID=A0ABY8BLV3_AFICR|nr:GNAT family N-acetyltransferase [[Pseudomonas] carboxydohydrogena]WEF50456.1 GNAT family N-acetyltransferase [[Pseudomonas] carboxydohydrogena]
MAQALRKVGLRPFLPADTSILAAIFIASIEELTEDSYSEAQREAWASRAEDEAAFGKKLGAQLTLVATVQGSPVGFASLRGADHLDMLFVHPGAVRQGVASTLCDAIEKLAAARGAARISVDASDSAQEFFAGRGYLGQRRNSISIGDEWLANTTMTKALGDTPSNDNPGLAS